MRHVVLTVSATLNHVDQKVGVIFAVNVTFMAVFMTWLFRLVDFHLFLTGKVSIAICVGTLDSSRSIG